VTNPLEIRQKYIRPGREGINTADPQELRPPNPGPPNLEPSELDPLNPQTTMRSGLSQMKIL